MVGGAGESVDWLRVRLRPSETAMGALAAILWIAVIGALIVSERMVNLVVAAFAIDPPAFTSLLRAVGSATARYWLLSFPIWSIAVVGSFVWALSLPEKRQSRLAALLFSLVIVLFATLVATYIPFAQAAASIAQPFPTPTPPLP